MWQPTKQVLKAGVFYFTLVFGAGFVLGPIRVLLLAPRVGDRMAELMEAPVMLVVLILAARWIVRRFVVLATPLRQIGVGFIALSLLLVAEFSLVIYLRGMTIDEYIANRDPVSGTVYYVMLGVFAMMPFSIARKYKKQRSQ
jgi:hypothetical protein